MGGKKKSVKRGRRQITKTGDTARAIVNRHNKAIDDYNHLAKRTQQLVEFSGQLQALVITMANRLDELREYLVSLQKPDPDLTPEQLLRGFAEAIAEGIDVIDECLDPLVAERCESCKAYCEGALFCSVEGCNHKLCKTCKGERTQFRCEGCSGDSNAPQATVAL